MGEAKNIYFTCLKFVKKRHWCLAEDQESVGEEAEAEQTDPPVDPDAHGEHDPIQRQGVTGGERSSSFKCLLPRRGMREIPRASQPRDFSSSFLSWGFFSIIMDKKLNNYHMAPM